MLYPSELSGLDRIVTESKLALTGDVHYHFVFLMLIYHDLYPANTP
jgi:hypothetical protein